MSAPVVATSASATSVTARGSPRGSVSVRMGRLCVARDDDAQARAPRRRRRAAGRARAPASNGARPPCPSFDGSGTGPATGGAPRIAPVSVATTARPESSPMRSVPRNTPPVSTRRLLASRSPSMRPFARIPRGARCT